MTDEQLQIAIDKTAVNAGASSGETLRNIYRKHLEELLKVQAVRAGLASYPTVKLCSKEEVCND
jgi:hypothetical protein